MGGNYEKLAYKQYLEVVARLEAMESEHKKDRKEIRALTAEVTSLRKENTGLHEEVSVLKQENTFFKEKCSKLEQENSVFRDDIERMKRSLNNDSSNSSIPPSARPPVRSANTYNGRKPSRKKPGAQADHKGSCLSKPDVELNIRKGLFEHRIETIGEEKGNYITRYRLDLEIRPVATEFRIYADERGKYQIPDELRADVSYGDTIKAIAAFLYSEGVVANDRICTFINSISGDTLKISTGSIYNFCRKFSVSCAAETKTIEQLLLNSDVLYSDATTVTTNGKQSYVRNVSNGNHVLYYNSDKKNLETLNSFPALRLFSGILVHDHETALYHFGTGHGECNVHLERYLRKNTEETGNI